MDVDTPASSDRDIGMDGIGPNDNDPIDMEELEKSLTRLSNILDELATQPSNIPLLKEHVEVARKCQMDEQVDKALEMLSEVTVLTEAQWEEYINRTLRSYATLTEERLAQLLPILHRAASDFCSANNSTNLIQFLTICSGAQNSNFEEMKGEFLPASSPVLIPEEQARALWKSVMKMADFDLTYSPLAFNLYLEWETRILESLKEDEEAHEAQVKRMNDVYLSRFAVPNSKLAQESQQYSTFNTTYSPSLYEANMILATKITAKPLNKFAVREEWENGLSLYESEPSGGSHSNKEAVFQQKVAYLYGYLNMENAGGPVADSASHQKKEKLQVDWKIIQTLYERLLACLNEYAAFLGRTKGRAAEVQGKAVEAAVWEKYGLMMASANGPSRAQVLEVWQRSVRSCPGSGGLWSKLMRIQEINQHDPTAIGESYFRALSLGELTRQASSTASKSQTKDKSKGKQKATASIPNNEGSLGVEELVKLELAWAGFMRRQQEASDVDGMDDDDDDKEDVVAATLRAGIKQCKAVDSMGDPKLVLEKYLISWLERKGNLDEASDIWETASKVHGKSYLVWQAYTDFEIRRLNYPKARTLFKNACNRPTLDWPEAVWDAWIQFEEFYGSAETLEAAKARILFLQEGLAKKRAQESAREQTQLQKQLANTAIVETQMPVPNSSALGPVDDAMEIDGLERGPRKRKAEDAVDEGGDQPKRVRFAAESPELPQPEPSHGQLQRDREHATVFVAGLAPGTTEASVKSRFIDCGEIREVIVTEKPTQVIATVEFVDRESVPAALTKDKKKIDDVPIAVYVAWKSTLFITNFPETADDASMRQLFEPFGEILSTRWPSKKFKSSRRFLFLQFISAESAMAALELHGKELEPNLYLSVQISDPERKKERTDADADRKEVYVTQLSKFVKEKDLKKFLEQAGTIKRIKLPEDAEGNCRGFAFVDFETKEAAEASIALTGSELKKRAIAISLVDPKAKNAPKRQPPPSSGLSSRADLLSRSVRLKGVPGRTQEGLLEQELSKLVNVKFLEVFEHLAEATAELNSAADVGVLLLRTEPFAFNGSHLTIEAETDPDRGREQPKGKKVKATSHEGAPASQAVDNATSSVAAPAATREPSSAASFVPRPPRGAAKKKFGAASFSAVRKAVAAPSNGASTSNSGGPKNQDAFRQMLLEGKKT